MSLWGGEPTLFPNYIEICKKINDYGSRVFTTTNGSRSKKYLSELIHHSCISISVHEDFYDQNRMISNIKSIVEEIQQNKLSNWIMVRCMVLPGSLSHWKNFVFRLSTEIPNFEKSVKLSLNTLVSLSPDKTEFTDTLMPQYTKKELDLLYTYGRLTEI